MPPRRSSLAAALLVSLLVASAIAPAAHAQCTRDGCNDGDLCTTEVCNPITGLCVTTSRVICNDGNLCTTEACQPATGLCVTTSTVDCNDGNLCTTEFCNPTTGQCQTASTVNCDDNNACTTETCNPTTGQCLTTSTVDCNDSNLCTTEACNTATGQCQTTSTTHCNDNNACTTDVCNPTTGQCQTASNWCGDLSEIAIGVASRGSKLTLKRKKGGKPPSEYIKVTMSQIVVTTRTGVPEKVKVGVKATVTGEEAQLASLVYPIAKLTRGAGAATDLQNSGWDFGVIDTSRPCQDVLSSDECSALASQLSKTIDASLASAPPDERDGFRQGAGLLGVPPNDCVFNP